MVFVKKHNLKALQNEVYLFILKYEKYSIFSHMRHGLEGKQYLINHVEAPNV